MHIQSNQKPIILWLALLVFFGACKQSPAPLPAVREYELTGRIESIDLEKKRATIAHDEIKDYMQPMTMTFTIPDEAVLKGLKSGDRIRAKLIYDSRTNLSWLENVRREGE